MVTVGKPACNNYVHWTCQRADDARLGLCNAPGDGCLGICSAVIIEPLARRPAGLLRVLPVCELHTPTMH